MSCIPSAIRPEWSSRAGHRWSACWLLLLLHATCAWAGVVQPPSILTVGNTANCDHASIQAAIDAAPANGSATIRISNNVPHNNQALSIQNKNIELRGGYPGCDLAPGSPTARTTIRGNGVDSVITIFAVGNPRTVILRNVVVRGGGSSDPLNEAGGGVRISGTAQVEIRASVVADNQSAAGGGIHIAGGDAQLLLDDGTIVGAWSTIPGNRAVDDGLGARGGGIVCDHADLVIADASIRRNVSDLDGGGIHSSVCAITINPRPEYVEGTDGTNGVATFFENRAERNGGAIHAVNGLINWYSSDTGHFAGRALGNSAGNSGGTLHLSGNGLQFTTYWVRIEGSGAVNTGGAVHATNDARLNFGGASGMSCSYDTCPAIFESNLDDSQLNLSGGAIYAAAGARISLGQTVVARNVGGSGSAIIVAQEGTRLTLRQVLVHQNFLTGANSLDSPISVFSGADADLIQVTMVGNLRPGGFLFQAPVSSVLATGAGSTADLFNSIFTDDAISAIRGMNGAQISGSCLLGHENTSVSGITIGDPAYRAPSAEPPDFTPWLGSDALDRCATAETFPMAPLPDLYGRIRPVANLELPTGDGLWDMGALESSFGAGAPEIFADGFE